MRVLAESHDGTVGGVSGTELLELVRKARTFLAARGLQKGDRCGLLAPNNIQWVALDLAMMAEGLIVVPLYARQTPAELVAMMKSPGIAFTLVPKSVATIASFMAKVGSIPVKPESWKDMFFPNMYDLPGS